MLSGRESERRVGVVVVSCVGDDIRRTRATVGLSSGASMSSTAVLGVVFSK